MLKDENLLIGIYSDKNIKTHCSLNKKSSRNVYKIEKLCKRIQKLTRKDEFINTEVGISIMMNIGNKRITTLFSGSSDSVCKSLDLIKRDVLPLQEIERVKKVLIKRCENENN